MECDTGTVFCHQLYKLPVASDVDYLSDCLLPAAIVKLVFELRADEMTFIDTVKK